MTSIAREPLATPSTWLGPELLRSDDWVRRPHDTSVRLYKTRVDLGVVSDADAFAGEEVRS
ncbi:MAG: hypothetical protein ABFS46_07680 [Myxococcota bacterium]